MKKGYTLVELLAVIVLLSVVLGLVAINAIKYFNQRKEVDYSNIKALIEDNAKVLVNTEKEIYKIVDYNLQNSSENTCKLSYDALADKKLMDKDTKNPKTDEVIYESGAYVKIELNPNTYEYSYEYVDTDSGEGLVDCLSQTQQ